MSDQMSSSASSGIATTSASASDSEAIDSSNTFSASNSAATSSSSSSHAAVAASLATAPRVSSESPRLPLSFSSGSPYIHAYHPSLPGSLSYQLTRNPQTGLIDAAAIATGEIGFGTFHHDHSLMMHAGLAFTGGEGVEAGEDSYTSSSSYDSSPYSSDSPGGLAASGVHYHPQLGSHHPRPSHQHHPHRSHAQKVERRHTRGMARGNRFNKRAFYNGTDEAEAAARANVNAYSSYFDPSLYFTPTSGDTWGKVLWRNIAQPIFTGALAFIGGMIADRLYYAAAHHHSLSRQVASSSKSQS